MVKKWNKLIFISATLILVLSLLAACGQPEAPAPAPAPAPEVDKSEIVIKIADNQFESLWINNALVQYILEKGYGYTTETVSTTTPIAQVALTSGDMDIWMEMWQQNFQEAYDNDMIGSGKVENVGDAYEGGPQFWIVPKYTADEFGIKTVDDMKALWKNFEDPEDPTKGVFINCPIGWQCEVINAIKMEAYGLTEMYNVVQPGSGGALDATLSGAQKKGDHIFGYHWSPTALMGMYDWVVLEEPAYDKDVWAKISAAQEDASLRPIDEASAYESLPVDIGINVGLRDKAPDAVEMLEKYTAGVQPINVTAAWANENEVQEWETAAIFYLRNYEDLWKTWVTPDAYEKIKAALALES